MYSYREENLAHDLRIIEGYTAILNLYQGRSKWLGSVFPAKAATDFIERLTRIADHSPDEQTARHIIALADQIAG